MIFDSYFLRTPIISLINLIPKNIIDDLEDTKKPLPTKQIFNPNSLGEIIKIIKDKKFDHSYFTNKELMLDESYKNFNFPRKKFASVEILNEIIKKNEIRKRNLLIDIVVTFVDLFIGLKTIKAAYRINLINNQLDKLLNPVRIRDKLIVNQFLKKILKKIK